MTQLRGYNTGITRPTLKQFRFYKTQDVLRLTPEPFSVLQVIHL